MAARTTVLVYELSAVTTESFTAVTSALGGQVRNDGKTILVIVGTAGNVLTIRSNMSVNSQDVDDETITISSTRKYSKPFPTRLFNFPDEYLHLDLTTGTTCNVMALRLP